MRQLKHLHGTKLRAKECAHTRTHTRKHIDTRIYISRSGQAQQATLRIEINLSFNEHCMNEYAIQIVHFLQGSQCFCEISRVP